MAEPVLRRGRAQHDWVVYAQQMLNQALTGGMHIDVPENGVFDEEFEAEVKGFQERVGLDNDGVIGDDTWEALKRAVEAKHAATPEEEDEPDAPRQREQREKLPSQHRDDNVFRQEQDADGNTVSVYDMEGETVVGSAEGNPAADRWNAVVNDMVEKAERRNHDQISYIHDGVKEFTTQSEAKIAQFMQQATEFEENSHVDIPWGVLIDGLEYALSTFMALEGPAAWVYGQIKGALIDPLAGAIAQRTSAVPGIAAKLSDGVTALGEEVRERKQTAIDAVQRDIRDTIHTAMLEYVDHVTFEGTWIEEMVTYYGFPEPNEGTVTQVIAHSLNQQFDVMLQAAQQEMLQAVADR